MVRFRVKVNVWLMVKASDTEDTSACKTEADYAEDESKAKAEGKSECDRRDMGM